MSKKELFWNAFVRIPCGSHGTLVVKSLDHNPVTLMKNVAKYSLLPFRSFAQFKASAHNHSLQDGYGSHTTTLGTEIDSLDFRVERDGMGRPTERYDQATFVPTDSVANIAALIAAYKSAKVNYMLFFDNCSHVPTEALKAAGKKDGEPAFLDDMNKEDKAKQAPETKQKKIKNRNPDAKKIK